MEDVGSVASDREMFSSTDSATCRAKIKKGRIPRVQGITNVGTLADMSNLNLILTNVGHRCRFGHQSDLDVSLGYVMFFKMYTNTKSWQMLTATVISKNKYTNRFSETSNACGKPEMP